MTAKRLVQAGLFIDGKGAPARRNVDLLVEGSRIAQIGARGQVPADGAQIIDATAQTILPGLIDAHVHICSDPERTQLAEYASEPTAMRTILGVRNARTLLESGITTIRTLGTAQNIDLALRDAIKEGVIAGPRIIAAGRGITITGGHGHYFFIEADGVDEMRKAARAQIKAGVNVIKLTVTGGVLTPGIRPGVPKFNYDEIEAVIQEAHKAGIKVAAHAEGLRGVNDAIAAGIDSIEHGYFMDNEEGVELMLEHGTYLVPTVLAYDIIAKDINGNWTEEAIENAQMALEYNTVGFRRALEAGIKIAMGSDTPASISWRELIHLVINGMTPMQAIVAATQSAAELLGLGDQIGTLEVGKQADLIAVVGNPLDDIAQIGNIRWVMQQGDVVVEKA
jgi:imidazolonepropionase-like amidohydrolase